MLKTPHNDAVFFYAFVYLYSKAYGYIIIRKKEVPLNSIISRTLGVSVRRLLFYSMSLLIQNIRFDNKGYPRLYAFIVLFNR